jgi:hypothetical protein
LFCLVRNSEVAVAFVALPAIFVFEALRRLHTATATRLEVAAPDVEQMQRAANE